MNLAWRSQLTGLPRSRCPHWKMRRLPLSTHVVQSTLRRQSRRWKTSREENQGPPISLILKLELLRLVRQQLSRSISETLSRSTKQGNSSAWTNLLLHSILGKISEGNLRQIVHQQLRERIRRLLQRGEFRSHNRGSSGYDKASSTHVSGDGAAIGSTAVSRPPGDPCHLALRGIFTK